MTTDNTLPIYQVDAFTDEVFRGNPAAVCPLDEWLPDETLQSIAAENNLSETAFLVAEGEGWRLRWFTPREEVPLCGHATLASAFVLFRDHPEQQELRFATASGELRVRRAEDGFTLDFPVVPARVRDDPPAELLEGLGVTPVEILASEDDPNWIAVLESETDVIAVRPRLDVLERLHPYGVVVTAPGVAADFVSRYFAPSFGIPEDPVTGSIHCALAPYWAGRLGHTRLRARQLSARGGALTCELSADRVLLTGQAVLYLEGEITLGRESA